MLSDSVTAWNSPGQNMEWVAFPFSGDLPNPGTEHGSPALRASLVAQRLKRLPAMWETWVRSLGRENSPGEGNGNPLQYSCLENPMDGGTWWGIVHGAAKSWTRLSDFTFTFTPALQADSLLTDL